MKNYYTQLPDFSGYYLIGGSSYADRPKTNYQQLTTQGTYKLKEVRDYVKTLESVISLQQLKNHLKSLGVSDKRLYLVKRTVEFYEQQGLISFVPNYEGNELLFTNTKYFKKIWKT